MPYGPTKFVNGQNQGAVPANTQVIGNDIQVILPEAFASAKPVYPLPRTDDASSRRERLPPWRPGRSLCI